MKRTYVNPNSETVKMDMNQMIATSGEGTARVPDGSPWQSSAMNEPDDLSSNSYW